MLDQPLRAGPGLGADIAAHPGTVSAGGSMFFVIYYLLSCCMYVIITNLSRRQPIYIYPDRLFIAAGRDCLRFSNTSVCYTIYTMPY